MTRPLIRSVLLLLPLTTSGCYLLKSASLDETCEDTPEGCGGTGSSDVDADGDGYSSEDGDCDDTNAEINPGANDIPGDGIDQDCDGVDGPSTQTDADGDGYYAEVDDCDDTDAEVNPGRVELCATEGIDDDCDGLVDDEDDVVEDPSTWFRDSDGDGYGDTSEGELACQSPAPDYASRDGDCDDDDRGVNPGAEEVCDNGIDDNCNGSPDACRASGFMAPGDGVGAWQFAASTSASERFHVADVTGDGYPDGILGLRETSDWPRGGVLIMDSPPIGGVAANGATATASVIGSTSFGFGQSVLGVADLTGNGVGDLLVTNSEGDLHLFEGPIEDMRDANATTLFVGFAVGASSRNLHAADLTNDGFADLIVAGPIDGLDGFGRVLAKPGPISGDVNDLTRGTIVDLDFNLQYPGTGGATSFGEAIHTEDLDGDGIEDLVVGMPDGELTYGGVLHIGGVLFLTDPYESIVGGIYNLPGVGSDYGAELSSADFDGDGRPELVVGAPAAAGADASSTGVVYIHQANDVFADEAWATISASDGAVMFGSSLATGQTDGYDYSGIVIGAPSTYLGDSGEVIGFHAIEGGSYLRSDADFGIGGSDARNDFGAHVELVDMDNDGIGDVFSTLSGFGGVGLYHLTGI